MASRLEAEHLLLGAFMAGEGEVPPVRSYGDAAAERAAFDAGVALVDLDGLYTHLYAGPVAPDFATTVFAGTRLGVGECAFEAALLGDTAVASVALLARTGDAEYVVWDLSPRSEVLDAWLGFLASVEQHGVRPYEGLESDDVGGVFVPLLLAGPEAPAVLSDYLGTQALPTPGTVASLKLDRIACLVAAPPLGDIPAYLVLTPPRTARVLWRSFLSFPVVTPVGSEALDNRLSELLPWYGDVAHAGERIELAPVRLRELGLVRQGDDFVGARGLSL